MARFRLARLLRRADVVAVLVSAAGAGPTAVTGPDGAALWRAGPAAEPSGEPVPVHAPDGTRLGAVTGSGAMAAALALSALVELEVERRQLADEVLGLYREINVLYSLAATLADAVDRTALAERVLAETTRLVPADAAAVLVRGKAGEAHRPAASAGRETPAPDDLDRARIAPHGEGAVLVAPLAVGELAHGALVLRRDAAAFTASDLKLAGAVAAQAAAVLARVLEEERRSHDAAGREEQLRRQVDRLRIELDDRRQAEQVQRIIGTDYFADLRDQAVTLRRIVDAGEPAVDPPASRGG